MENQNLGSSAPNPVAEEQFRKGFEHAKVGNIDEGILAVEAAIVVSPDEGRYHDLLGTLYAKKGLYDMAVGEWKRSIECDSDHAEIFRRIETAQRMKVQKAIGGNRWNVFALVALAALFVVSTALATHYRKAGSSAASNLDAVQSELAQANENSVSHDEHQKVAEQNTTLQKKIKKTQDSLKKVNAELNKLRTASITTDEHKAEVEIRNRVQSELAAAREKNKTLQAHVDAIGDASGTQALVTQIQQKEAKNKALENNYQTLNEDRKRMEGLLEDTKKQVVSLTGHVADLQAQAVDMVSATESRKLRTEIQSLRKKLADAKTGATTSKEEPLVAGPKETEKPKPAAKPTVAPTKKPVPKPTPKPKPPKAKPTATPVLAPVAAGDVGVAEPRPIGSRGSPPRAVSSAPSGSRPSQEERAKQLYEAKKRLTDDALAAIEKREWDQASRLVDRAYQIDPSDPRVNQLRNFIRERRGG